MSSFTCQSIEYIFAHHCELSVSGETIPSPGFSFEEISSKEKNIFKEKGKNQKGNVSYQQSVKMIYKYKDISEIQVLSGMFFILRILKNDGTYFTWGSLNPYNPVQLKINSENGIAELQFFRNSVFPEK